MQNNPSTMSDTEWEKVLSPEQFRVLRQKGTEAPFSGEYVNNHEDGIYRCAACSQELFRATEKFESGSGWPSFYDVAKTGSVMLTDDNSHGMQRTEVTCSNCGGHLGHLFPDGPREHGGQRYCINSVSLNFDPSQAK